VAQCYIDNSWWCTQYLKDNQSEIQDAFVEHIWLTVVSVLIGLALAIPVALLARRFSSLEGAIVGGTTIIYTIPSLALFSLLLPFTGITATTVIIGLALYSLTILVRGILVGLRGVPSEVVESAVGNGYGAPRLLFAVQFPLALPVIMASLRVATVSTVALTTVGTIVAYGGLGNLLSDGFQSNFKAEILTASVLCVVLAVVLDLLLVAAQWLATPWSRAKVRA
jgi:osmoprotectant transport system permease protein